MAPAQLTQMFTDLHRFHDQLEAAVEARLVADCGLALGRYEVLEVISRTDACRVNDIADELAITWGGASKLVDRLEAAQLCTRRPNPDDGRSSLIRLTAAGKRALTKARKSLDSELDLRVGGVLGQRPLDQLATALRRLNDSAREWDGQRAAG